MFNLPPKILETQTLTAPAASVTFTLGTLVMDWDALAKVTSRHLVLLINAASEDAVAQRDVYLQFNADAGANYNYQTLEGEAAVASAARLDAQNEIALFPIPGTTYADAFGGGEAMITHAFGAVNQAALLTLGGAAEDEIEVVDGRWTGIAAITSVVLAPSAGNFAIGSEFHLAVVDERYCKEEILLAADGPVAFRNIEPREGDLVAVGYCRSDVAANADNIGHDINDDGVAANYFHQWLQGSGAGAPTAGGPINNSQIGICVGDNPGATIFSPFMASYLQPSKAANQPHILTLAGYHQDIGPTAAIRLFSARWANIEPITKLEYTLLGGGTNFMAGSLFSLCHVPKRLIKRIELQVDTPIITFDPVPQDFETLVLNMYTRSSDINTSDAVTMAINGDAVVAHYDRQYLQGLGAGVTAARLAANVNWFSVPGDTAGSDEYGGGSAVLFGYKKSDRHKHIITIGGDTDNRYIINSNRWEGLAAITRIDLSPLTGPNFKHGSVFELWGIMPTEGLPAITVGG